MGLLFAFVLIVAIPAIAYYELMKTPGAQPPFGSWLPSSVQPPDSRATEPGVTDLSPEISKALEAYAARQPDPKPSRSEMIRKILEDRFVHEGLIAPGEGTGTRT